MNFELKLKDFFIQESRKNLIPAQKRLLENKRGVKLDNAPSNKPSTIKRKGFDHWLKDTGKTKENAFEFSATDTTLSLFVSEKPHPKSPNVTYRDLLDWHTDRYSGFYEQLPQGSLFPVRLYKEVQRQIVPQIDKGFTDAWKKFGGK